MRISIRRLPAVRDQSGFSRSAIYREIKAGLWTPPVKLGRASGWPEYECDALTAARIAGKTDDEIRDLVKTLVAARARLIPVELSA